MLLSWYHLVSAGTQPNRTWGDDNEPQPSVPIQVWRGRLFQHSNSQATFNRGFCKGFQSLTPFSGPEPCLSTPLVRRLFLLKYGVLGAIRTRSLYLRRVALYPLSYKDTWRGGRDSNPRRLLHLNHLAGGPDRPLRHLPRYLVLRRRERDSNPRSFRLPVFKTGAIVHSAIPPAGGSSPQARKV